MKDRHDIFLLAMAVASILVPLFVPSCANTTLSPSGGDKDTIPPYIVNIKPAPGCLNVPLSGAKIVISFNEYVKIKDAKNILLSPPLSKPVKSRISEKSLILSFEEELSANTTYTLNLTDAIADNNEDNMFQGYTYVFSTGEKIDSMYLTGTVLDCSTLEPVKGATVLLYKDHSDSAVFLHRPDAAVKTDAWGYFTMQYLQDTLYRMYAIDDKNNDFIYDPSNEKVGFVDSLVAPLGRINDSIPELFRYDMLDTLGCMARKSAYDISIFKETNTKQFLSNTYRLAPRSACIAFKAPFVWIDSLWFGGYPNDRIISQMNLYQDSLELWLNDRRPWPDTLHLFVNYRRTNDSTGLKEPSHEHLKLTLDEKARQKYSRANRHNIAHTDTICGLKLTADPALFEENGFELMFDFPVIYEHFDSIRFTILNQRLKESKGQFTIERDSLNLRHYYLRPTETPKVGFEYIMKIPQRTFQDINGFWCDSLETKVKLPSDPDLNSITLELANVDRKIIVDILDSGNKTVKSFITSGDASFVAKYLAGGKYSIRITEDVNDNSIVDAGSVLEHRQSEKVVFYEFEEDRFLTLDKAMELVQRIDVAELLK